MSELEFDAVSHAYKVNGVAVPSVTQILADVRLIDLSMVPQVFFARACEFGGVVHQATDYSDRGILDENSIDKEVLSNVKAWRAFISDHDVKIFEVEKRVYSKKFKFAGTLDRVGLVGGELCIIDIKTGVKQRAYACQTAAYALAYTEMTGEKIRDRYCVYLLENSYKVDKHTDRLDENMFLNALSLYNYKMR